MYQIITKKQTYTLDAKARYYREFKMALGVQNLKAAFFTAFENVDVDFLAGWIKWFNKDRQLTQEQALDIIDDYLETESDEQHTLYGLYTDCADFLNGMGFFGKRLEVPDGEPTIAYFEDKMNKISMDEKMANAVDSGLSSVVNQMVEDELRKKAEEA